MPHETNILEHAERDNLGTGVSFLTNWDFEVINGSFALIDGIPILGRDIAFATQMAMEEVRGETFDEDFKEEVRIIIDRIRKQDGRIDSITVEDISPTDDTRREVEVTMTVVAITDERGEFVLSV